jgi:hypothetical protein
MKLISKRLYADTANFFSSTQTQAQITDGEEGYSYNNRVCQNTDRRKLSSAFVTLLYFISSLTLSIWLFVVIFIFSFSISIGSGRRNTMQIPIQLQLEKAKDLQLIEKLLRTNWYRFAADTLHWSLSASYYRKF